MGIKRRLTTVGKLPYHRIFGGGLKTPPLRENAGGPPWTCTTGGLEAIRFPSIPHNYGMHARMKAVPLQSMIIGLMFIMHRELRYEERHGYKRGFTTYAANRIVRESKSHPMAAPTYDAWNPETKKFEPVDIMQNFTYRNTFDIPGSVSVRPLPYRDHALVDIEVLAINDLYEAIEEINDIVFPWKTLKARGYGGR